MEPTKFIWDPHDLEREREREREKRGRVEREIERDE